MKAIKSAGMAITLLAWSAMSGTARAQESQNLSDAEIAHIVVTANSIDVQAGKMAKAKTKNPEVKEFAQNMITDHAAVNKQATALTKQLGVKPESNQVSQSLKKTADQNAARLKKLKGKEFDRAYVNQEVTFHQAVLDTIDQTLIPNAKNEELRTLIEQVRPNIAAHLAHARHLQSSMATS